MLATGDARDGVDDKRKEHPEEAWDDGERTSQRLHRKAGGVGVRDVIRPDEAMSYAPNRKMYHVTHTTEKESSTRMNFPPPFHGERTWLSSPPVLPFVNASTYAWFVIVIRAAPRISTNVIGMKRPKNVKRKTRVLDVSTGSLQL